MRNRGFHLQSFNHPLCGNLGFDPKRPSKSNHLPKAPQRSEMMSASAQNLGRKWSTKTPSEVSEKPAMKKKTMRNMEDLILTTGPAWWWFHAW